MPTRPLQLSATTLGLYQECPRCFWLHMRAGVKRPARPFPSITRPPTIAWIIVYLSPSPCGRRP